MKNTGSTNVIPPQESGMVLILVVMLTALSSSLLAGIYLESCSQSLGIRREMCLEKAFNLAEAGVEHARAILRSSYTNQLTNALGEGNYQVSIYSNVSQFGQFVNTNIYTNITFIICSTGIVDGIERHIETAINQQDPVSLPANADAALAYYGTNSTLDLQGSGGKISGEDYAVPSNFYANGGNCWGDLTTNADCPSSVYSSTTNWASPVDESKIEPAPPTQISYSGAIYTESYWTNLVNQLLPYAELTISNSVSYQGTDCPIGIRTDPIITLIQSAGTLTINGGVDGAGILIIYPGGHLVCGGNFHYEGLIIGIGNGATNGLTEISSHGTPMISGAVVGVGGAADVSLAGSGGIRYSSQALANLQNIFQTNTSSVVYWREIK